MRQATTRETLREREWIEWASPIFAMEMYKSHRYVAQWLSHFDTFLWKKISLVTAKEKQTIFHISWENKTINPFNEWSDDDDRGEGVDEQKKKYWKTVSTHLDRWCDMVILCSIQANVVRKWHFKHKIKFPCYCYYENGRWENRAGKTGKRANGNENGTNSTINAQMATFALNFSHEMHLCAKLITNCLRKMWRKANNERFCNHISDSLESFWLFSFSFGNWVVFFRLKHWNREWMTPREWMRWRRIPFKMAAVKKADNFKQINVII